MAENGSGFWSLERRLYSHSGRSRGIVRRVLFDPYQTCPVNGNSVMNRFRSILAALIAIQLCACGTSQNAALRDEIIEMVRVDQLMRERVVAAMAHVDFDAPPTDDWIALVDEQNQLDESNGRRLEEIVELYGWPTIDMVGPQASSGAQVILQHGSVERKKRLLPELEKAVSNGQALARDMAMVRDSILVADGQNQIYGTQIVNGPNGEMMLYPVEEPDLVDERRGMVGLPPLEDYLRDTEKNLGRPIAR